MVTKLDTPVTVQELRELVLLIRRGAASIKLGTKSLNMLGRLVEHPEIVAVNTITELAHWLGANPSTLSRLARSLGYSRFVEFQRVFRNEMTSTEHRFYTGQAVKLFDREENDMAADCYLETVIQLSQESVKNIEGCVAQLKSDVLHTAVKVIANAKQVQVYGVRQMHAVVTLLAYGLSLIRSDVGVLNTPGQGIAENLAHMSQGDVLIVSSVEPYSRSVVEAAQIAKRYDITVIVITDHRASPLLVNADISFFVPHQSGFISNSIGASIVFCEGLINAVAQELGEKAFHSLQKHEQFISELGVEIY